MAQGDVNQFLFEWLSGGHGTADEIVALMTERYRNNIEPNVGVTVQQADEILTAMGYSDSAKVGVLDIYNALVAGVVVPDDVKSALILAEGGWPYHQTVSDIRDRVT